MSDLVFIAFDNEKQAEEVRDKVLEMQREYLIEVDDAVVVVRDQNGRVKLNQLMHPAAGGAVAGAFWGMLIGWLFLMPVAGAAVGAAGGALGGALVDVGINDQDMKQQANEALKPGTAGLFLLIRKMTTDKVLEDLKGVGGTVIRTSFDHAKEDALKTALAAHVAVLAPATPRSSRPQSRPPPPRPDRRWKACARRWKNSFMRFPRIWCRELEQDTSCGSRISSEDALTERLRRREASGPS